jgi:hypothetical protein
MSTVKSMMTDNGDKLPDKAELMDRLREMTRYLPALEDPDFRAGEFVQKTPSGATVMPYVRFADVADAFIDGAYEHGWVLRNFDWGTWAWTDEAQSLCEDPNQLARATPEQLLYLLTAIIRQDRFWEGALLSAFESGLILGIVRRAAAILKRQEKPTQT